jgi:hypothetical protein
MWVRALAKTANNGNTDMEDWQDKVKTNIGKVKDVDTGTKYHYVQLWCERRDGSQDWFNFMPEDLVPVDDNEVWFYKLA